MAWQTLPLSNIQKPKDKLYRLYDGNGLVMNVTPMGANIGVCNINTHNQKSPNEFVGLGYNSMISSR